MTRALLVVVLAGACAAPASRAPTPTAAPAPAPAPAAPPPDLDVASFSAAATAALADEACPRIASPYFWTVTPRAGAQPSYLLGTMHLGIDPAKLPASVLTAFDAAAVVVFETDPAAPDEAAPEGQHDLPAALGPDLWQRYAGLVGPDLAAMLATAAPATAALILSALYLDKTVQLDGTLGERARDRGQATAGLETSAFQQALISRWIDLRALRATIQQADSRRELRDEARDQVAEYCAGTDDTPGMAPEDRAEMLSAGYTDAELTQFEAELLDQRNLAWIPQLEAYLTTGGAFVVVGADHLRGDLGVPALLRAAGWTVTRTP